MLYTVDITLDKDIVLSKKQMQTITSKRRYWWLKSFDGEFYDVGELEGSIPFSKSVLLPIGYYTIGCGTPKSSIKFDFRVSHSRNTLGYFSNNPQLKDIIINELP